ncbi:MAG: sigma-70 family RNA polymerase sigma factor [Planctomycetota bacterium]
MPRSCPSETPTTPTRADGTSDAGSDTTCDHAFGDALVALTPRLRGFVRRLCLRDDDDVVQECLTRAWRSRRAYRPADGRLEAWLLKIAFRAYLDLRGRRGADVLGDDDALVQAPADASSELRDEVGRALASLRAVERDVLLRFHRDGQSIDDIARALLLPAGTVKSHLHRARGRLTQGPS